VAAIVYHASHEQFSPSLLLKYVHLAEEAGFDAIHSSDHFHPWSVRQGQSGYSFSWIAAALQATHLPFSMVCAPGQRYHPAIVAQAIATLCEMFPGRINFELGSGEAVNECITGEQWPSKDIRNERLLECAGIIRALLKGEEVNHTGHVVVKEAKLYTLPSIQPSLFCAAISEKTSGWAGSWADGLLTTAGEVDEINKKIDAFYQNGGQGKPVYLQYSFSYAHSKEEAVEGAFDQWRSNMLPREKLADLCRVKDFDEAARSVSLNDVQESIPIFTSIDQLKAEIKKLESTGANAIVLHNVNTLQETFIRDWGGE
jgi:probable non-F420 flavinoid oxidoreductase